MANDNFDEVCEVVSNLSDYYSDITGRNVDLGVDSGGDIWISGYRTYGKEYFPTVQEAERRLEILYESYLTDNGDTTDPLEGYW